MGRGGKEVSAAKKPDRARSDENIRGQKRGEEGSGLVKKGNDKGRRVRRGKPGEPGGQ